MEAREACSTKARCGITKSGGDEVALSTIHGIRLFACLAVVSGYPPALAQIAPAPTADTTMVLQWADASGRVSLDVKSAPWFIDTKPNSEKPFQAFELKPFPKLALGEVRRIELDRYCIMQERFVPLSTATSQAEVNATVAKGLMSGGGNKPNRIAESDGVVSTYGESASDNAQMVYRYFVVADQRGMIQFRLVCHAFADRAETQAEAITDIRKALDLVRIDVTD